MFSGTIFFSQEMFIIMVDDDHIVIELSNIFYLLISINVLKEKLGLKRVGFSF